MSGGFGVRIGCTGKVVAAAAVLAIAVEYVVFAADMLSRADDRHHRAALATDTTALREAFCPATFDLRAGIPPRTRIDDLVPLGAIGAVVCTYLPDPDSEVAPLTGSVPLRRHVGDLVVALNHLPTGPLGQVPDPASGDLAAVACGWLYLESYAIVFLYPGDPPVIVWVYAGCGVLARGGDVRNDRGLATSRVYW